MSEPTSNQLFINFQPTFTPAWRAHVGTLSDPTRNPHAPGAHAFGSGRALMLAAQEQEYSRRATRTPSRARATCSSCTLCLRLLHPVPGPLLKIESRKSELHTDAIKPMRRRGLRRAKARWESRSSGVIAGRRSSPVRRQLTCTPGPLTPCRDGRPCCREQCSQPCSTTIVARWRHCGSTHRLASPEPGRGWRFVHSATQYSASRVRTNSRPFEIAGVPRIGAPMSLVARISSSGPFLRTTMTPLSPAM